MSAAAVDQMFLDLLADIRSFRARAEGDPGSDLASLGQATGPLAGAVRSVAESIQPVLVWLYETMRSGEGFVVQADALVALLGGARDMVAAVGEGVQGTFGPLVSGTDVGEAVVDGIADGMQVGAAALDIVADPPRVIPDPSHLRSIGDELAVILGDAVREEPVGEPGIYGGILERIRQ